MATDPLKEDDGDTSTFEKVVDEIHEHLRARNFIVSRMKLRRALIVFAAQRQLPLTTGAEVMEVLLDTHVMSPAQLIELA